MNKPELKRKTQKNMSCRYGHPGRMTHTQSMPGTITLRVGLEDGDRPRSAGYVLPRPRLKKAFLLFAALLATLLALIVLYFGYTLQRQWQNIFDHAQGSEGASMAEKADSSAP